MVFAPLVRQTALYPQAMKQLSLRLCFQCNMVCIVSRYVSAEHPLSLR